MNKVRRSATSDPRLVTAMPEVCADVVVARGQFYWEVDVCNSSSYRIGEGLVFFSCLLFPESNSNISQQDCACLSLLSRVNAHADKKKKTLKVHSDIDCTLMNLLNIMGGGGVLGIFADSCTSYISL